MSQIPSETHKLDGALVCERRQTSVQVAQAHVLKHPIGMGALFGARIGTARRLWNEEGWDMLAPPVITLEERRKLVQDIGTLAVDGASCQMPRLQKEDLGGDIRAGEMACYQCPETLASTCAEHCGSIRARYVEYVDSLLARFESGQATLVSWDVVSQRALGALGDPAWFEGLAVLSLRTSARDGREAVSIARISTADGLRCEFYVGGKGDLRWRTLYRQRVCGIAAIHNFAINDSRPLWPKGNLLSESVLVPRLYWQERA